MAVTLTAIVTLRLETESEAEEMQAVDDSLRQWCKT